MKNRCFTFAMGILVLALAWGWAPEAARTAIANDCQNLARTANQGAGSPFENVDEAADVMMAYLACVLKSDLHLDQNIRIVVGKTQATPDNLVSAFSRAISRHTLVQVATPQTWVPVLLKTGDQFEFGAFRQARRDVLERANGVLALDAQKAPDGLIRLEVRLLVLKSLELNDGRMLRAGTVIPGCVAGGFVRPPEPGCMIQSEGQGWCNKAWDADRWEYAAKKAAELNAKANLIRMVTDSLTAETRLQDYQLTQDQVRSAVQAYIQNARVLSQTYDPDTCRATVKMAVAKNDIQPLLASLTPQTPPEPAAAASSTASQPQPESGTPPAKIDFEDLDVNDEAVQAAMREAKANILADLRLHLRQRLQYDGISTATAGLVNLDGWLDLPDCETQTSPLLEGDVPPRQICKLDYEIAVMLKGKRVVNAKNRVQGQGSNLDAAWRDALWGVVDDVYPLVFNLALTLDEKSTLQDLHEALVRMDRSLYELETADIDRLMDFVRRQIESLE